MNEKWKNTFSKLYAGGCGTQLGMLFTCGAFSLIILIGIACTASGVLGMTINQILQDFTVTTQVQPPLKAQSRPVIEAPATAAPVVPAAAPQPTPTLQPTPLPIVDLLPTTGNLDYPNLPPPIVTATGGRANLRIGPGTGYPRVGVLPADASLPIVGRNADMSWWLVSTTEGLLWISADAVTSNNVHNDIPVVDFSAPPSSEQVLTAAAQNETGANPDAPLVKPTPTLILPGGTPTAAPVAQRIFIRDTPGWKKLTLHTGGAPVSEAFGPHGDPLMLMDGVKLHLIAGDGTWSKMLADTNSTYRVAEHGIWSPDGEHISFTINYLESHCRPCKGVAIYRLADERLIILETPNDLDAEAPRWTQDGRLIVLVHPQEPADGIAYEYNTAGQGKIAEGTYLLSAGAGGQKWYPWLPGREWTAGTSIRASAYYRD